MKSLDEIKLLIGLRIKKSSRNRFAILSGIFTSFSFFAVYVIEIVTIFFIKKSGFENLEFVDFLIIFLFQQSVFMMWLGFGDSLDNAQEKILTGEFDIVSLKPINFSIYKYVNAFHFDNFLSSIGMFLLGFALSISNGISSLLLLEISLFIILGMVITIIFDSFLTTFVFFIRDPWRAKSFSEFLLNFFQKKPPEIFPSFFKLVSLFLVPYVSIFLGIFSIYKGENQFNAWISVFIWLVLVLFAEKFFWRKGLKKYESMG